VRRKLADGSHRWHFYAWHGRGAPKFWVDDVPRPTDPAFFIAYAETQERRRPGAALIPALVDDFLSSPEVPRGERSRADLRKWTLRFAQHFEDAPVAIFEDRRSRDDLEGWRAQWRHSPRQHDAAGTHAVRVLNWAVQRGRLKEHWCHRLPRLYAVDRSAIVWTDADRSTLCRVAPEWVQRVLTAACETGLRPADLCALNKAHIETLPSGARRLRVRTAKRQRWAHVPVTPPLAAVIDATPADRLLILAGRRGGRLTPKNASDGLRQWRGKAGLAPELRLQDCRGTAATMLLNAGLELAPLADFMGWSVRYAAQVIEHYARVSPAQADAVLVRLAQARAAAQCDKL
jgi:integrase